MERIGRLHFIDCARTYAVILALLSHSLLTAGVFQQLGDNQLYIRQFTRMATPMFVFMFGFMIEFVYVRKAIENGLRPVRRRLYVRAFQCYFAFILTSFCSFIGEYKTFSEFVDSLVFLGDSHFGNILRVYALIMLVAPLFIKWRMRFGPTFLLVALVTVICSFPVMSALKQEDFGSLNTTFNIVLGIGPATDGPSAWHSLCFVFAGMLIASSLQQSSLSRFQPNTHFYFYTIGLMFIFCCAWSLLIDVGYVASWWSFVDATYRKHNMPGYFIIGSMTSVVTILLFRVFIGHKKPPLVFNVFLPIGLSSLLSYTAGNVLLNLFGKWMHLYPLPSIASFFLVVLVITRYISLLPYYQRLSDILNFKSSTA